MPEKLNRRFERTRILRKRAVEQLGDKDKIDLMVRSLAVGVGVLERADVRAHVDPAAELLDNLARHGDPRRLSRVDMSARQKRILLADLVTEQQMAAVDNDRPADYLDS